jgi:5'-methylthioadenosine phosphorylase
MVTDYDSWHPDHGEVDITSILAIMNANVGHARSLIERAVPALSGHRPACAHGCDRALEFALMTAPDQRDPALLAKLDAVAGRVLG